MELFGMVCALPMVFVAAVCYSALTRLLFRCQSLRNIAVRLSWLVLGILAVEWIALLSIGPVRIRAIVGAPFYAAHLVVFCLAIPAAENILLVKKDEARWRWLKVPALCAVLALPLIFTQYAVSEALYGVNGDGGPYGKAPTLPMPDWW